MKRQRNEEKLPRGIRRRGHRLYAYLTDREGKAIVRSLRNLPLSRALKVRARWQLEICEGVYIKPKPRTEIVMFEKIADAALKHYENFSRDWSTPTGRIKVMKAWWEGRVASEITTQEINEKFLERVRAGEWSECTSNEYRIVLSKIFSLAIDRSELTLNPVTKSHRYKLNNQRTRELSAEEETKLRAAILANYPSKLPELDLALHTGLRRSSLYGIFAKGRKELPALQWEDVDFNFRVLRVRRAKSGHAFVCPLDDTALAALRTLLKRSKDGQGEVIRKPSGIALQSCRKWFEESLETAGIANLCWHDLRHTFATRLRRNGVALEDIAALLDHAPLLRMTARYAHVDMDKLHNAVKTLDPKTVTETGTKTGTVPVLAFRASQAV